ncbi:MAG: ABC transporter permease [Deltaproteobacteria bacterium]|nr:ABC transporter permease [Deltaproteobacteria bacterium]
MIPTFFLISLVVFVLINLAPGNPGGAGGLDNVGTGAAAQSASVILFKRQFNLDKPILVNTRPWLDLAEVRALVTTANGIGESASGARRIAASNALEDSGEYLVRHLVTLLAEDPDPAVRQLAAEYLTSAASLPLVSETAGDAAAARDENRRRDAVNSSFSRWACPGERVATPCLDEAAAKWAGWWPENRALYEYTAAESIRAFLFDTRFATYWVNLARLDFGISATDRQPVLGKVLGKLKYSVTLSLTAVLLAYLIAVPVGVFSAVKSGSKADTVLTVALFLMYSLPTFFTGTVLLMIFSQGTPFEWFPVGRFQSLPPPPTTLGAFADIAWHLALPVATSTSVALAALSRYARSGVIDVIRADYIRTARAKGLEEPVVILKHAVRNGMIPILTLLGGILPVLVSGSVVIEVVFSIPGMGSFLVDSITNRDYNAVMAVLLASAVLTLVGILVSDLSYALVDPRINLD